MWTIKGTFQEALDTGGILLFGLGCLFLFRQQYYPNVLGPLSFGMISVGALGFVRHITKDLGSRIENSKYQEILLLLEQRQSEIEANRCMLEELRDACSRFMAMREILEAWQGDPSLIEERATILAKILEPRDVVTSRESTQKTPNDALNEPLDGDSRKESENRAVSEKNVGEIKRDVQQEKTGGNPKSLQEQALKVHSNISATLQSHATESIKKEDTGEQCLQKTDDSEHEAPESVPKKVAEEDIVKQDEVLKEIGKIEDSTEYKLDELRGLSKNGVEASEMEEPQRRESNESNGQKEIFDNTVSKEIQNTMAKNEEFLKEVEQVISEV